MLARERHDHERRLAHDQRLFDERKVAYARAVTSAQRLLVSARVFLQRLEAEAKGEDTSHMELPTMPAIDDLS